MGNSTGAIWLLVKTVAKWKGCEVLQIPPFIVDRLVHFLNSVGCNNPIRIPPNLLEDQLDRLCTLTLLLLLIIQNHSMDQLFEGSKIQLLACFVVEKKPPDFHQGLLLLKLLRPVVQSILFGP